MRAGKWPQWKLTLPTPWPRTAGLQNCNEFQLFTTPLLPLLCALLRQPGGTNTLDDQVVHRFHLLLRQSPRERWIL